MVQIDGEDFCQPDYTVTECGVCSLLNKHPILSEKDLEKYYSIVHFEKWDNPKYYPTEVLARKYIECISIGSSVLDFGCSSGRFLSEFSGKLRCYGIEKSEAASDHARDKGIDIISLEDLSNKEIAFDLIFMIDVFEHLSEPMKVIQTLEKSLLPGGKLIIVTGNGDYWGCQADPAKFWYFKTVEHVCMITRRHAEHIAKKLSMRVVKWERCSHYDTPAWVKLFQYSRHILFYQYRQLPILFQKLISNVPFVGRVAMWSDPPLLMVGQDHVVVVFEKSEQL